MDIKSDDNHALVRVGALLIIVLASAWFLVSQYNNVAVANYLFASAIGFAVGATEMMARYRDRPFLPMMSAPGVIYIGVNAGAAALAYYLIEIMQPSMAPILHVMTAGIGAMAFFRSGIFTVRLGDADVAIGPNLILQILLQALDRSYDRDRAAPRSDVTTKIMEGISFEGARSALPAICFNLMQNVSQEEQAALAAQIGELAQRQDLSDETKSMVLGLALLNIVGEKTLQTAVNALGKTVKISKPIDPEMSIALALIEPEKALSTLPNVCNTVCHESLKVADPAGLVLEIGELAMDDESKALLALYKLIQTFGPTPVSLALRTMRPVN